MTINRNLSILAGGVSSTGVLGVPNGGSGATTLSGYLFGNGTSAFTASSTIPTSALSGTVSLTSQVSGILPIANGGTAQSSFTAGYVHYGSFSTSANFFFDGTNLGLGTSTPSTGSLNRQLTINSAATNLAGIVLQNNATGTAFNDGFQVFLNGLDGNITNNEAGNLIFTTNATERARIFSSGGVSIGNTTDPGATNLSVNGVIKIGSNQAVNGPAFSAYINADQTVTSTVVTKVTFNNEQFDTNNNFDSTTNYRFTPTIAGYYQVNVTIAGQSTVTLTGLIAYIYKNGASYRLGLIQQTSSNARAGISDLIYMNGSTDYLEIYARCDGTGTLAFAGGTTASSFSAAMVRGA